MAFLTCFFHKEHQRFVDDYPSLASSFLTFRLTGVMQETIDLFPVYWQTVTVCSACSVSYHEPNHWSYCYWTWSAGYWII